MMSVQYLNGVPCVVERVTPDEKFWRLWHREKPRMMQQGYFVRKVGEEWQVRRMRPLSQARGLLEESVRMSYATTTDFEVPVPVGKRMFDFQRAGVAYAYARRRTLLADPMGLGKTVQAVGLMNAMQPHERVLVVCPAALRLNWLREIRAWDVYGRSVVIAEDRIPADANVVIVNYDRLDKFKSALPEMRFGLAVLDEAHYLKSAKAKRTQLVFGGGKDKPSIITAERWLSLTGTPMLNRPAELWTHVRAYDPHGLGSDWHAYHTYFCAATQRRIGGRVVWDVSGAAHADELNLALRATIMIRREKQAVLGQLPPKLRQYIPLLPSDKQTAELLEQERQIVERATQRLSLDEFLRLLSLPNALPEASELAKLRKQIALSKSPIVAQHALDALEDPEAKLVVFAWHRAVAESIADAINQQLGSDAALAVHGGMTPETRQAVVDAFQHTASPRVLCATMPSLGVGVTLTRANTVLFAELSWTPADIAQAEDRLHRIGQSSACHSLLFCYVDSLESYIAQRLVEKESLIAKVMQ